MPGAMRMCEGGWCWRGPGGCAATALAAVIVGNGILALWLGGLSPHPVTVRATHRIGNRRGLLRSVAAATYWLLFSNPLTCLPELAREFSHPPRGHLGPRKLCKRRSERDGGWMEPQLATHNIYMYTVTYQQICAWFYYSLLAHPRNEAKSSLPACVRPGAALKGGTALGFHGRITKLTAHVFHPAHEGLRHRSSSTCGRAVLYIYGI